MSLATKRLEPAIHAQKQTMEKASKLAAASMGAIDLVKVYNSFNRELWQYQHTINFAGRQYLVQASYNAMQMGYVGFWVISIFVAAFWYGIVLVEQGLEPGNILTTFYATLTAIQSIETLLPNWIILSKGKSAGMSLSSIVSEPNVTATSKSERSLTPEFYVGDLELTDVSALYSFLYSYHVSNLYRQVSFAYPTDPTKLVLNKSSFTFPAGQMAFLVGRSGSGKSTVGNLIANLYQPTTGIIEFDGEPMTSIDRDWLHANITLVQQSSVVFNDTFGVNVSLGHSNPDKATREDIIAACDFALLQSTLADLPHGLDTEIGSGGQDLSGGQMQKLALARARLRDPQVLILDEITSGMDHISRDLVMDAIRDWRQNKTTIIITHDVDQIHEDDLVYVMEDSSLVQQGLKRELGKHQNGPFAKMIGCTIDLPNPWLPEIPITRPLSSSSSSTSTTTTTETPSRFSQFLISELESNGSCLSRSNLGRRRSFALGANATCALKLRRGQIMEHSDDRASQFSYRSGQVAREHNRFSDNIQRRMSTPHRRSYKQSHRTSSRNCKTYELGGMSRSSKPSERESAFIFGAVDRRDNISTLRSQYSANQHTSDEGVKVKERNENNENKTTHTSLLNTLKTVWPTLSGSDRLVLILGMLVCIIGAASTPAFSYCLAKLFGVMWSSGDKAVEGKTWAISLIIIAVGDGLTTAAGYYMMNRVGQSWVNELRSEALNRILKQPRSWFNKEKNSPSRINECLDRNAEEMRNIVALFVPIITTVSTMIAISLIWAMTISWRLTMVALAPLPIIIGSVKAYAMLSSKWESRCNSGAEETSAILTEALVNIRVVRCFTLEKFFGDKFRESVSQTLVLGWRRAIYTSGLFGLYQSMCYPLTALVFYYATILMVKNKHINTTEVLQVVNLLLFSVGNATDMLSNMPQLTMAQATATKMLAYANLPLKPSDSGSGSDGANKMKKVSELLPVRVKDLTFSYSRHGIGHQVLRGVSFEIRRGTCTAIVGPSSCGKSTLLNLLLGLYAPSATTDSLSFDGVSSCSLDMQHSRSMMAYVPQTPFLFPTTIYENIVYGLPAHSEHRNILNVEQAAKNAGLHEFITSLSEGYGTPVGDGGLTLSGGQAQRLSIARALVRRPQLLILDEPTSALDAECASIIRRTIRKLVQESNRKHDRGAHMAIVMVTHSRDMMQVADNIVMLDGGVKVDEGSYQDLLQAGGPFRDLVAREQWGSQEDDMM